MNELIDAFLSAFKGTVNYTWKAILFEVPWYKNYFWGLLAISLFVWLLEILFPWRKNQSIFRKDFWLDGFYMFFNFFIFTIIISGVYKMLEVLFWATRDQGRKFSTHQHLKLANLGSIAALFCTA